MKKTLLILLAVLGLCACKKAPDAVSVPFEKVEHYFSIVDGPISRKIMDQASFDSMFDIGYVMGMQQEPLDFGKEFVIAVINSSTDVRTTLTPVSLVKQNGNLVFTYNEKLGEKSGTITKPTLIVRVNKQYDAPLQIIRIQE